MGDSGSTDGSTKQWVNGSRKNRTTRTIVTAGLFSIHQARKGWFVRGHAAKMTVAWSWSRDRIIDLSLGRVTSQVRLEIHSGIYPGAVARCSFIGFRGPSREWCTIVSLLWVEMPSHSTQALSMIPSSSTFRQVSSYSLFPCIVKWWMNTRHTKSTIERVTIDFAGHVKHFDAQCRKIN